MAQGAQGGFGMSIYELASKASRLSKRGGVMPPVWHVIMSAIENAMDTVGTHTGEEFDECARLTLESNLCFPNELTSGELKWLRNNGVSW